MRILDISNVIKSYQGVKAVDNVSLHVEKGEVLGLLGPNGAGKTTLINTITTLETPDSGSIHIAGFDLKKDPRICKALVGCMPQEVINHGYFTVKEVLKHHSGYYGLLNNEERTTYLMKKLSLWAHRDKKILKLSGGMKRRLLLAKALVHDPPLILLDEPTTGVDVSLRQDIWNLVKDLRQAGKAILFTTHYLEEAEELCDRITIINKGYTVTENSTINLIKEHTVRTCIITLNRELDLQHKTKRKVSPTIFEFSIQSSQNIGELLQEIGVNLVDIKDIRIQEGRLEDAFKNVLKDE